MTPVDLIDVFKRSQGRYALIATYDFDPVFFERRLLHTEGLGSAERILVLMDSRRYERLLNDGVGSAGFNRRYLVIPVAAAGAFHPKLYLVLGKQRATSMIGSCNCTTAGIAYNVELCSVFSADLRKPDDYHEALSVIRRIYEALKAFVPATHALAGVLDAQVFRPIEEQFQWLHRDAVRVGPQGEVQLFSSSEGPIWPRVVAELKAHDIRSVTVLSPFYDHDLRLVARLRRLWPAATLTVVAQPKYANLPAMALKKLSHNDPDVRLLAASPPPGRRLHAKALVFGTNAGTYWLTGSANATAAALDGLNAEASLWIRTEESAEAVVNSELINARAMDPSDFEPGLEEEFADDHEEHKPTGLVLSSVVLTESGLLEVAARASIQIEDLSLRLRNFNEELPMFSIPMPADQLEGFKQLLTDEQINQIRGTVLCELKARYGVKDCYSNRVSLIQLNQLLKERGVSGSGTDSRRKLTETGENFIPYMDQLGSKREVIEFLTYVNIKFDDGQSRTGHSALSFWRPRDPFKPDMPNGWLSMADGVTDEDMRAAIWTFVLRHQRDKLTKHVRRGNLNGLRNFLDIFRTLNSILLAFNKRETEFGVPIIPHAYLTTGMIKNLELLIGPIKAADDQLGFIDAVKANLGAECAILRDLLKRERVAEMVCAAAEALIDVRRAALNRPLEDKWSSARLCWVHSWIETNGLGSPTPEDIAIAKQEYGPSDLAA